MKHIISIGINNTNGLTPLGAAISGAEDFVEWGKSQGYSSSLLVDKIKSISQSDIFNEINKIVEDRNCEKLIVFFSGHGILKSPSQEVWLLSDAKTNPNESINLTGSIDNARTSGIPYIVFISDACRVLPNELQFTGNGSVIFPICDDTDQDCAIDVLYATRPGSPALEQKSDNNSKKNGLFTQTIVEILNGSYPELIKTKTTGDSLVNYYDINNLNSNLHYKNLANGTWHIDTINSEASIKSIVSEKARKISISLKQNPDIRIQHQNPKPFLSEFDDNTAKQLLLTKKPETKNIVSKEKLIFKGVQKQLDNGLNSFDTNNKSFKSILNDIKVIPDSLNVYNIKSNLIKNSEIIFDSKGKSSFETQTGFTVIGAKIQDVIVNCNKDIFEENNKLHIRIYPEKNVLSLLITLNNGHSIPVAILDGYIGTLIFEKNRLLTINYTPSKENYKYQYYKENEKNIDFVRAFVASAANEGFDYSNTFRNEFSNSGHFDYSNAGSYLRQQKSVDPSLGLYAVYAYRQEGKLQDIKSVYSYMRDESDNILFDVAMLSNKLQEERIRLVPFCPMIALGWAYLQKFEKDINPLVVEASKLLVPGLWTTFDKKGTEIIKQLLNQNQLR